MVTELTTIKSHYVVLAKTIWVLESSKLTLVESLQIVTETQAKIQIASYQKIRDKFAAILQKNIGLKSLAAMASNNNEEKIKYKQLDKMTPADLAYFKYAPFNSCDVERSFSQYKNILTDRRRSFTLDNLIKHLIISCNSAY